MKKVFLTAITIAMLWGIKAFGMYGWNPDGRDQRGAGSIWL